MSIRASNDAAPSALRLPGDQRIGLDAGTRRSDGGRTLLGGSPLRLMRLSPAGAALVDRWQTGEPVGSSEAAGELARRLLDAGLAHPIVDAEADAGQLLAAGRVHVVVPVRDDAVGLAELLDALAEDLGSLAGRVTVVDDGSTDLDAVRAVADRVGAGVAAHLSSAGPGAARNTGWFSTDADYVAFVDADVVPEPGWLDAVLAHFVDPAVAAVAPRVRSAVGPSLLSRYERHRSPLDLGDDCGRVAPRSRVSYVPSAAIVFRRLALADLSGFADELRVGEDVDLVWRAAERGWTVRYEPAAVVRHRNRPTWVELARQRFAYGRSSAALDERHPGAVTPVEINVWSAMSWAMAVLGGAPGLAAGTATAAVSAARLVPDLQGRVDQPIVEAARLGLLGHLWAGKWLASAVTRAWLPAAGVASLFSRRARRAAMAAAVVPALVDWVRERPAIDPVRWTIARIGDDAAYCAGVWRGVLDAGSTAALKPELSGIPGVTDRRGELESPSS